mmetsp:Transcript_14930/g.10837  ORF Transcript_14930/g.10837 Transcript_14930/m.10837 type:complete len:170 (+) Transcript_14930:14-523(+)
MELFISSDLRENKLSFALQLYAKYVRADSRNIVKLIPITRSSQAVLKIFSLPMLVKSGSNEGEELHTANPFSMMSAIAKAAYLEEVLVGKPNSIERSEILSFVEMAHKASAEELISHLNTHLEMRMFVVGHSITAADITLLAFLVEHFSKLSDYEKLAIPHVFRWIDHV